MGEKERKASVVFLERANHDVVNKNSDVIKFSLEGSNVFIIIIIISR